jgi:hypothetical protein
MTPPPIVNLGVAHVFRIAKRRRAARPAVGADTAAFPTVAHEIEGAGAGVPGRLIGRDTLFDDFLPNLSVRLFGAGAAGKKARKNGGDPEKHCPHSVPPCRRLAQFPLLALNPDLSANARQVNPPDLVLP